MINLSNKLNLPVFYTAFILWTVLSLNCFLFGFVWAQRAQCLHWMWSQTTKPEKKDLPHRTIPVTRRRSSCLHLSPCLTGGGSRWLAVAAVPHYCWASCNKSLESNQDKSKGEFLQLLLPKLCVGPEPLFVPYEACCLYYFHSVTRGQNGARSIIYSWIFVLLKSFLQTLCVHHSLLWPCQGRHQGGSWDFSPRWGSLFSL